MKPTPTVPREVQSLIEAVCDGMADDAQVRDLESLLLANQETRNFYVDFLDLDAKLQRLLGSLQEGDATLTNFIAAKQTQQQIITNASFSPTIPTTAGWLSSGWPMAYLVAMVMMVLGLWGLANTYIAPSTKNRYLYALGRGTPANARRQRKGINCRTDHRHG